MPYNASSCQIIQKYNGLKTHCSWYTIANHIFMERMDDELERSLNLSSTLQNNEEKSLVYVFFEIMSEWLILLSLYVIYNTACCPLLILEDWSWNTSAIWKVHTIVTLLMLTCSKALLNRKLSSFSPHISFPLAARREKGMVSWAIALIANSPFTSYLLV